MTTLTAARCAQCGAENLGTRFCESCGTPTGAVVTSSNPAPVAPPPPIVAVASAPPAPPGVGATAVRAWALVWFLLSQTAPGLLDFALARNAYLPELHRGSTAVLVGLAGLFALIAALAGRAGAAGKTFGALFALGYAGVYLFVLYVGIRDPAGIANGMLLVLSALLLFLSWALGRPFRGPGYFGLLIFLVVATLSALVPLIPGLLSNYPVWLVVEAVLTVFFTWLVVGLSVAFERAGSDRVAAPAAGVVPSGAPTNGRARVALVLVLGSIGGQVLTYVLSVLLGVVGFYALVGWSWVISLVAFGALIAGIVFGHLGRSQARRSGERGAGPALAALIIGYSVIGFGLAAFLVQLAALALAGVIR